MGVRSEAKHHITVVSFPVLAPFPRFPDATEQQLAEGDNSCIICMEEMKPPGPKRLPCGHMLHLYCLRSWMERQQVWIGNAA
jgi:hypothetical protein